MMTEANGRRAIFSSNTPLSKKRTLRSRAQTARSCLNRRSPSTLPSYDLLLPARDALATMTSDRAGVVLVEREVGVLDGTARIWKTR